MLAPPSAPALLHLSWFPGTEASRIFARSLAAFLRAAGARIEGARGQLIPESLVDNESFLQFSFSGEAWQLSMPEAVDTVHLSMPTYEDWIPSEPVHHLQPDDDDAALPLLTLYGSPACPTTASLHNLVALALASGPLRSALLEAPRAVAWTTEGPGIPFAPSLHPGCLAPLDGTQSGTALGTADRTDRAALLYVRGLPEVQPPPFPTGIIPAEILAKSPGTLLRLVPTPTEVHIELAPDLDPSDRLLAEKHARAHIRLRHILPGDTTPHLDSRASILSPRTRWDRLVYASDPDSFSAAHPQSLDDCSPRDQAVLGLWSLIGGMLGGTRPLHPAASTYQQAAYQRQAAERLVAQLDSLGGAMLCDGVGLGKTYVATTVIVHFVNHWCTEHPAEPFRITVVAPGSVVSTWEREALPPLATHGVPLGWIRVLSHSKLSRLSKNSAVLQAPTPTELSDFEHLALSDLVIIDEAHNFRSEAAARTRALRDLLAIQPRKDQRRRVLLLTATPINNRLADLEQELSLMFSQPVLLSDAKKIETFRQQSIFELRERVRKARAVTSSKTNVAPLLVLGNLKADFGSAARFNPDLEIGPAVKPLEKYLRREELRLAALQDAIKAHVKEGAPMPPTLRIAEELLDRVVVQRSRALCKRIEQQAGGAANAAVDLLFRRDPAPPERLLYDDSYNETTDVLKRFLELFPTETNGNEGLSFKVYMWSDVSRGIKLPTEAAPAVALQQVLALKRLESSPVSFLISLLRLTVQHAVRLRELDGLCEDLGLARRAGILRKELSDLLEGRPAEDLALLRWLCIGDDVPAPAQGFFESLRQGAGVEEEEQLQTGLFDLPAEELEQHQRLERLWELKQILLADLRLLLDAAPPLARIVFGAFDREAWPARFIAPADERRWPRTQTWGRRVVTDAKLAALLKRLLLARQQGHKIVVFSQFKDSIAYLNSVFQATTFLTDLDHDTVTRELGAGLDVLLSVTDVVTGDTEDRDAVIDRFAPFYRIGPFAPPPEPGRLPGLPTPWEEAWKAALRQPIDVLFATDVLAEGVNLQDVALLINYDIHWNPVRMIQRSGRIDRRLNGAIERAPSYPDLETLALAHGLPPPAYAWAGREAEAPVIVNLILPDALEEALQLRERIASKTLAIDVTLGLDRGTGAEAAWMDAYTYQGVAALSAYDRDRAIEDLAGTQKALERHLRDRAIPSEWAQQQGIWLREQGVGDDGALVSSADIGRVGATSLPFTRYLEPAVVEGVPHWLLRGPDGDFQFWLRLEGDSVTEEVETSKVSGSPLAASPTASSPLLPAHVLPVARRLLDGGLRLAPHVDDHHLWQGLPALADGRFYSLTDRSEVSTDRFFLLQFRGISPC